MTDLNDILAALPALQPHERQQLRKALDALNGHAPLETHTRQTTKIARPEWTAEENRLLEALRRFMLRNGAELVVMSQLKTDQEFRDKVPPLFAFIRKIASNRQEESAVLAMGLELIYNKFKGGQFGNGRTLATAQALLSRIHRIPALINQQFPGYAEAGVLTWVFRKDSLDAQRD